jgi:5'-3' exonuclease
MGVPGFFSWLMYKLRNANKTTKKKLIITELNKTVNYLMLDTNCLLHPCVNFILEKYDKGEIKLKTKKSIRKQLEKLIWERIKYSIDDMISKLNPEYLYIAIDGVAPMGKILQQRQRRYKYLFDKKIRLQEILIKNDKEELEEIDKNGIHIFKKPVSSIELTPGTDYMERIHQKMLKYVEELKARKIKCIYSSYHSEGEGEHKILQYIKKEIKTEKNIEKTIIIYGLDADLLFLSLSAERDNIYVMREKQIFNNTELNFDDYIEYNYVQIDELKKMITELNIEINDFIIICYLVGNDFLPNILTLDIKNGGLDKIVDAYEKVRKENNNARIVEIETIKGKRTIKINHILIKEILRKLLWTERHIWENINREKPKQDNNQDKMKDLNDFVKGINNKTECLEKIEFKTSIEYYNYYLGIDRLENSEKTIKKMVKEYIKGFEWCINYYLDDCINWEWGYNYSITPTIKDIINYYPKTPNIKTTNCELKPIEQLILAIPIETYNYVIKEEIINKIRKEKTIGYMFPTSYDIDINKDNLYWKCQVKIPNIEYKEYIKGIKKIKIEDIKNDTQKEIKNY